MKLPILAALIALGVAASHQSVAAQRNWYILNFGTGKCVRAAVFVPYAPTPEAFHAGLRSEGHADTVNVHKDDDGNMKFVTIASGGANSAVTYWFPDAASCEIGRTVAVEDGIIPDPDDLK